MNLRYLLIIILVISCGSTQSQSRETVILRMTDYNAETNESRYYSTHKLLSIAGVAHDTTSDLSTALNYGVVVLGSRILQNTFTSTELSSISTYVTNGGVFIHSNVRDTNFFATCGIAASNSSDTLFTMEFDTAVAPSLFTLIDDSMEVEISMGRQSSGTTFIMKEFTPSTGTVLATYKTGKAALIQQDLGLGTIYSFAPDFRDIGYRNMLNLDVNAHRVYSNGFEPSTDVITIVLRNMIREAIPNAVWKHTYPNDYAGVVLITHDVDSRTALDTMFNFSAYEQSIGITTMYNVTTRYLSDSWMSNWYIGGAAQINAVLADNQKLGSHSVGHFPDFADNTVFPYGALGNTTTSYTPLYNSGFTTGGTVIGELEVSKDLLESDFTVNIRSFRAGHLAYPKLLVDGLEECGYEFNSTFSANDVLTNYPYYGHYNRSFSGDESSILEIPMTISDVFSSDPITNLNYPSKVATWLDVSTRYVNNYAPVTLLIHPNRMYKVQAQIDYVNGMPGNTEYMSMDLFGDYWKARDTVQFTSDLIVDTLTVNFSTGMESLQSLVIDDQNLDSVEFYDNEGDLLTYTRSVLTSSQGVYFNFAKWTNGLTEKEIQFKLWPNPSTGRFSLHLPDQLIQNLSVSNSLGQTILNHSKIEAHDFIIDLSQASKGTYFALVTAEKGSKAIKLIVQ